MWNIKLPEVLLKEVAELLTPHSKLTAEGRVIDPDVVLNPAKRVMLLWRLKDKFKHDWKCHFLITALVLEGLIAKLNRILSPRFIRCRLAPDILRIPSAAVNPLQSLGGRAPPPMAVFVPIPQKTEMGSCARSDLAVSAYQICGAVSPV